MTKYMCIPAFIVPLLMMALPARADHVDLLGKPYPGIELFPENIMKPYDSFDFPWIQEPREALPSNFQYILKPFFLQTMHWIC